MSLLPTTLKNSTCYAITSTVCKRFGWPARAMVQVPFPGARRTAMALRFGPTVKTPTARPRSGQMVSPRQASVTVLSQAKPTSFPGARPSAAARLRSLSGTTHVPFRPLTAFPTNSWAGSIHLRMPRPWPPSATSRVRSVPLSRATRTRSRSF